MAYAQAWTFRKAVFSFAAFFAASSGTDEYSRLSFHMNNKHSEKNIRPGRRVRQSWVEEYWNLVQTNTIMPEKKNCYLNNLIKQDTVDMKFCFYIVYFLKKLN